MYLAAQLQYVQLLYPLLPGPAESVAGVQTRRRTASLATGEPVTRPEIGSLRIPVGVHQGIQKIDEVTKELLKRLLEM